MKKPAPPQTDPVKSNQGFETPRAVVQIIDQWSDELRNDDVNLLLLRGEHGWTLRQVARVLQASHTTIQRRWNDLTRRLSILARAEYAFRVGRISQEQLEIARSYWAGKQTTRQIARKRKCRTDKIADLLKDIRSAIG